MDDKVILGDLEKLSQEILNIYFISRNYEELQPYMSQYISWIGTGTNEVGYTFDNAVSFLTEAKEIYNGSFTIKKIQFLSHMLNESVAVVMSFVEIEDANADQTVNINLRFSIIWIKEDHKWKIGHVHNSVSNETLNGDNYFHFETMKPVKEYKKTTMIDSVTKINNMEGFVESARNIFDSFSQYRYAVVKFGIKNFRYINRTYGYSFGDKVLANIGKNLKMTCQENETCGRIEKDIFAILYRYTSKRTFAKRMEQVRETLLDEEFRDKIGMKVHFTAGVYIPSDIHKESVKSMLDKALLAQMSIEADKYDYYTFFEKKMIEEKEENSRIIEMAPIAMKKNEFQLYIQPQFDMNTKEIVGGEALTRWKHHNQLIIPNHFIPLFEKIGYINEFDFHMLELLCQTLKKWMEEGIHIVPISINQSRKHLNDDGYIEKFTRIVDKYMIPHHYIVFELTESAFVRYEEKMKKISKELHRLGYLLAIDDFGTGYASLNFLSEVPADILKVDKSLIDNYKNNRKTQTIVESVIDMAHSMDMKVVCEGIEVQEQIEYLKVLKCDIGQGFVIGKPISAEQFKKVWLSQKQKIM